MDIKPEGSQPVPRQITIEILTDDMMTSASPVKLISLPSSSTASKVMDFRQFTMMSNVPASVDDSKSKDKLHQLAKPGGVTKAKTPMSKVITKEMIANAKEVLTIKKEDMLAVKDSAQKTYMKDLPKITTLRPILPKSTPPTKLFDADEDNVPLRIKQVSRVGSSGVSEKVNVIEVLPKAKPFTPVYTKVTSSSSTQAVSSPSTRGRRRQSRKSFYAYVTESESEGEDRTSAGGGGRMKKYSKSKSKKSSDAEMIVDDKVVLSARRSKRESLSQKLAEWGLLPKGQEEDEEDADDMDTGMHTPMSIKPATSKQVQTRVIQPIVKASTKPADDDDDDDDDENVEDEDDDNDDDEPEIPGPPPKFIKVSSGIGLKPSLTTTTTSSTTTTTTTTKPDQTTTAASSTKTSTSTTTTSITVTLDSATMTTTTTTTATTSDATTTILPTTTTAAATTSTLATLNVSGSVHTDDNHRVTSRGSLAGKINEGSGAGASDKNNNDNEDESLNDDAAAAAGDDDGKGLTKEIRTIMDLDDLLSGLQETKSTTATTTIPKQSSTMATLATSGSKMTTITPAGNVKAANIKSFSASAQQIRPKPVIHSATSMTPSTSSIRPSTAMSTTSTVPAKPSTTTATNTQTSSKAVTNSMWIKKASSMLAPSMHHRTSGPPVKRVDTMNKSLMCKPIMLTKATSCNPLRIHKCTQTEEEVIEHKKTTIVPIPVPFLVPAPITPCVIPSPYPIPMPVPVPVPCLIPATRKNVEQLMKNLQELYNKTTTNPLEAELLDMAEIIGSTKSEEDIQNEAYNATIIRGVNDQNYIYPGTTPSAYKYQNGGEDVLEMAMRAVADMPEDQAGATNGGKARVPGYLESSRSEMAMMTNYSNRSAPAKRNIFSNSQHHPLPFSESKLKLKYSYALKAWRFWAEQKNHDNSKTAGASRGRVRFFFDPDPLKLSFEELNAALSMFVRDLRKPTGEKYAPDSIYYLCLGLQYYLRENGRQDNIFFDVPYQKFTDVLNELMSVFELRLNPENMLICRVTEDHLWESRQLGCHTPQTLLNTLIYFNTKYFLLDSVESHMNLSFAGIERGSEKTTDGRVAKKITLKQAVSYRGMPKLNSTIPAIVCPGMQHRNIYLGCALMIEWFCNELKVSSDHLYTQHEFTEDPVRCPVRLYEFYLSKCPDMVRHHSRLFYLTPESSSRPENPVWFSVMALSRGALNKMINRIKVVREIQVAKLQHMQFDA